MERGERDSRSLSACLTEPRAAQDMDGKVIGASFRFDMLL